MTQTGRRRKRFWRQKHATKPMIAARQVYQVNRDLAQCASQHHIRNTNVATVSTVHVCFERRRPSKHIFMHTLYTERAAPVCANEM